tara:strand:- start:10 stop:153 length:144 start_codon:yes stop_codon:yes gene_type:complete
MGSRFAARYDGINPETTPTTILIKIENVANHISMVDGKILFKRILNI